MPDATPATLVSSLSPPSTPEKPTDETIKETLESIVIAFVLAFVFRAYVVEAFVIPTGSMAPTLLGEHIEVACAQCGYHFKVDPSDQDKQVSTRQASGTTTTFTGALTRDIYPICPMCHFPNKIERGALPSSGDRILVHKYIYSLTDPRRWDVVVFKNPYEPKTNFIKRLVGLPGESILIVDGNVYVKGTGGPDTEWRIARKGDRPEVQEAVWQPVAMSDYLPLDGGQGRASHPWMVPWSPLTGAADWELDGRRSYRFGARGSSSGSLRFDFRRAVDPDAGWSPYNQRKGGPDRGDDVEDVRVAASFQPEAAGLAVRLQTTARLASPEPQPIVAEIDAQGLATLRMPDPADPQKPPLLREVQTTPFATGVTRRVELWYVDQQASLWVDGRRLLHAEFEVPMDELRRRPPIAGTPELTLEVSGPAVLLHRVRVDRDLYYVSGPYPLGARGGEPGAGVLIKHDSGVSRERVMDLNPDEFYCLGDNSPWSHDSRFWNYINPWIDDRMLKDAPNQPRLGVVPRPLMMGRAFFVYYPAPFGLTRSGIRVIPNFGDMRFIH